MKPAGDRKRLIAQIHIAKTQLQLGDDAYRLPAAIKGAEEKPAAK